MKQRSHRPLLLLTAVVVLIAIVVLIFVLWPKSKKEASAPPRVPVTVVAAKSGDTPVILHGLGQVQAFNTFTAKSRVDGNITQIAYVEGQHVKAGDLLVQIDPRPFQASLLQTQGMMARDQAQLANAERDLHRYAVLVKPGLTARQVYDTQAAQVAQDKAVIQSDQGQVDQARLNLGFATIRAPFDGRAGERLVDMGNLVHSTDQSSLVVVTQMQPIFVTFTLPEEDLDQIRQAMQHGSVDVDAFDGGDQTDIAKGRLTVIDNRVDTDTGTVSLKAQFTNADERLWPGEFVNAHLTRELRQHGITVPAIAVQMGPQGRFVFRIGPDDKAQVVPVTVAQIENSVALVDSGLNPGDRVVIDGSFGLTARTPVNIVGGPRVSPEKESPSPAADLTGRTPKAPQQQNGTQGIQGQQPQQQSAPPGQRYQGSEAPGVRGPGSNERNGGGQRGGQGS